MSIDESDQLVTTGEKKYMELIHVRNFKKMMFNPSKISNHTYKIETLNPHIQD